MIYDKCYIFLCIYMCMYRFPPWQNFCTPNGLRIKPRIAKRISWKGFPWITSLSVHRSLFIFSVSYVSKLNFCNIFMCYLYLCFLTLYILYLCYIPWKPLAVTVPNCMRRIPELPRPEESSFFPVKGACWLLRAKLCAIAGSPMVWQALNAVHPVNIL